MEFDVEESPFLAVQPCDWVASNDVGFAIYDAFPVSPGHTLVVPHRPIASIWSLYPSERKGLLELVETVVIRLKSLQRPAPDGFTIGVNDGAAAGQTVAHAHVHVIPRYLDDVDDPRGGIRSVIPGRGNYLQVAPSARPRPGGSGV